MTEFLFDMKELRKKEDSTDILPFFFCLQWLQSNAKIKMLLKTARTVSEMDGGDQPVLF